MTLISCLAMVGHATAQIAVDVILEQDQFLRDEPLSVKVRVTNRSGQTIRLGDDNDWLDFTVQDGRGQPVERFGELPVKGEFSLGSAQVATRTVELTPVLHFAQPGRYQITATVRIKAWGAETTSKAKYFEIVHGTKLWEEEFGVPQSGGVPELRKYALQQASYQKQLRLYLRLTDATESRVMNVMALGPLVSFSRPEAQIDKESNLHVIFQVGARSFIYTKIDADGQVQLRQTHDYSLSRPGLHRDEAGRIVVGGGQRRFASTDIPPTAFTNFLGVMPGVDEVPATNRTTNGAAAPGTEKKPQKK
jgi:hypothetical protein